MCLLLCASSCSDPRLKVEVIYALRAPSLSLSLCMPSSNLSFDYIALELRFLIIQEVELEETCFLRSEIDLFEHKRSYFSTVIHNFNHYINMYNLIGFCDTINVLSATGNHTLPLLAHLRDSQKADTAPETAGWRRIEPGTRGHVFGSPNDVDQPRS